MLWLISISKKEMSFLITANVYRLGESREIELLQPTLEPMLNKDIKFSLCSSALLLPNRCCAFVLFQEGLYKVSSDLSITHGIFVSNSTCTKPALSSKKVKSLPSAKPIEKLSVIGVKLNVCPLDLRGTR